MPGAIGGGLLDRSQKSTICAMARPRSEFKLKLLYAALCASAGAAYAFFLPPLARRLEARAERLRRALAYVAARETHDYRGVPVSAASTRIGPNL